VSFSQTTPMPLADAVKSMIIDMPEESRQEVERAAQAALKDPKAFVSYVIITLGNLRNEMESVVYALAQAEIVELKEEEDATPSA